MRKEDSLDVMTATIAVVVDAAAIFGGLMWATWLRFDLVPLRFGKPADVYELYAIVAAIATPVFILVFRLLGLFVRPQIGTFLNKIPRLIKGTGLGILLTAVLAFSLKNEIKVDFSRIVLGISFFTVTFLIVLERYILYRIEWNLARHSSAKNNVLILGTDSVAAHVKRTLKKEPMLRSNVIGFMQTDKTAPDTNISPDEIKGFMGDLAAFVEKNEIHQIILTAPNLPHDRIVQIILLCERNLITFNMVPDLFRIMTSSMDVQSLDDIPLLGISKWPLDFFSNRMLKRTADVIGSIAGLAIAAPVIAALGAIVKLASPGPIFFRQDRCGENGRTFTLYKLRTMVADAEKATGPVFAAENDPRTTNIGAFMRRHNLDELPQLWNVFKGDMSLVGPRPERPHFVEKFKEDVDRYMWRHVSKPGMTGWAQVNGLRGNTSIEERIKYDLYYLENWSLAFDFKILMRTIFASDNAY
jgi:exopolysaccharide biosynthesis polyprenyl glycosylphosphotransferase